MLNETPDKDVAFGFRKVAEADKQGLVNEVFSKVAARYDQMNDLIKGLAKSKGALLADLNAAFKAKGNLPALFSDDPQGVHPNDAGYDVIADAFFKTIAGPRPGSF